LEDMSDKVIGAAIEVHKILGPGLLESIYEEALCIEFAIRDIPFERQKEVDIVYKGNVIKGQRIDILVNGNLVVELKAVVKLQEFATAQTLSYLKATGLKNALLINFTEKRLVDGLKRISL